MAWSVSLDCGFPRPGYAQALAERRLLTGSSPLVQRTDHDAEQPLRRNAADHPGVMAPRGVVAEHHEHSPRHHRVIGVRAWRRNISWPAVARESGDPFDQPLPLP